jgi:hypothetical protein
MRPRMFVFIALSIFGIGFGFGWLFPPVLERQVAKKAALLAAQIRERDGARTATPTPTATTESRGLNSHDLPQMNARPLSFDGQPMPTPTFTSGSSDSPAPTKTSTPGPTYTPSGTMKPQFDHSAPPVPVVDPGSSSFSGNGHTQSGYRLGD